MKTQLTAAHRDLLARILPLTYDEGRATITDRFGGDLLEIDGYNLAVQEDDICAEAVCIAVNETEALRAECGRLEMALAMACDELAEAQGDSGGNYDNRMSHIFLAKADAAIRSEWEIRDRKEMEHTRGRGYD